MTKAEEFKKQMLTVLPNYKAEVKPFDKEVVEGCEGRKVGAYPIEVRTGKYGCKVLITRKVLNSSERNAMAKIIGRQIKWAVDHKLHSNDYRQLRSVDGISISG